MTTRVAGHCNGDYPIAGGGGTSGERTAQGIVLKKGEKPKLTSVSKTLDTRIGSLPNFAEQYILEE